MHFNASHPQFPILLHMAAFSSVNEISRTNMNSLCLRKNFKSIIDCYCYYMCAVIYKIRLKPPLMCMCTHARVSLIGSEMPPQCILGLSTPERCADHLWSGPLAPGLLTFTLYCNWKTFLNRFLFLCTVTHCRIWPQGTTPSALGPQVRISTSSLHRDQLVLQLKYMFLIKFSCLIFFNC